MSGEIVKNVALIVCDFCTKWSKWDTLFLKEETSSFSYGKPLRRKVHFSPSSEILSFRLIYPSQDVPRTNQIIPVQEMVKSYKDF